MFSKENKKSNIQERQEMSLSLKIIKSGVSSSSIFCGFEINIFSPLSHSYEIKQGLKQSFVFLKTLETS